MEINLDTEIQYLNGVGPKIASNLNKLGIFTISDLIYHYPRRYEDYTQITKIADSKDFTGQNITVQGRILGIANKKTRRRGFTVTEAVVEDGSGSIKVVWFNQPYLAKMLKPGRGVILNGKVAFDQYAQTLIMESPNRSNKPKIVPVYPETAGISSYFLAKQIVNIKSQIANIKEFLPKTIIDKYHLLNIQSAIKNIHDPENGNVLEQARRRIAFDELFLISLRSQIIKGEIEKENAPKIDISDKELKKFADSLPFELTVDQKKAAWEIILDLKGREKADSLQLEANSLVTPMNRLLNGDVGSGKTVVAAFAAYVAAKSGFRVAFMAPTEILAKQHFTTLNEIYNKFDISVGLITASTKVSSRKNQVESPSKRSKNSNLTIQQLSNEALRDDIIVGTQALIQKNISIENLGLVIVDEQHRFGVNQRAELIRTQNTENRKQKRPHFLSMTATPIPRSLHLALFGDLDLSIIRSMPQGRKPIKTRFVAENNRVKAYDFIRNQIKAGRQAFVICPLIEEGAAQIKETLFDEERKSVMAEYEKLSKEIFPDLKIGMLHGRLKSIEKDKIMVDFKAKKLDILVSTSVVEVGVDIPNASIMMIEDAERFGLAQLHQFRGRVGRGEHQSFCFVFSSSRNPKAIDRLKSFEDIIDGFELAEIDLKNRGAGDMFGTIQSGYNELRMASYSDTRLIEEATRAAKSVAENFDQYSTIKDKIGEFLEHKHLE